MKGWDIMMMPPRQRERIVDARRAQYEGKRVRFIRHGEPDPAPLAPGEMGTVVFVDDIGTLSVRWDSGRSLGVCVGDTVEVIE
jgi:hypothetical protein